MSLVEVLAKLSSPRGVVSWSHLSVERLKKNRRLKSVLIFHPDATKTAPPAGRWRQRRRWGGRIELQRPLLQRLPYRPRHRLWIPQHLIIPEAQHAISKLVQDPRPSRILCPLPHVLSAIDLDDKACLRTAEIHDEASDRMLLSKRPPPSCLRRREDHSARSVSVRCWRSQREEGEGVSMGWAV